MENVREIYALKRNLNNIKNQLFELEDKADSIEGNYHLQKAQENLTLAIGRLVYEFNIHNDSFKEDSDDKEPSKPYAIGISDIYSELDVLITQNWDLSIIDEPLVQARNYVINTIIWVQEELKRLCK